MKKLKTWLNHIGDIIESQLNYVSMSLKERNASYEDSKYWQGYVKGAEEIRHDSKQRRLKRGEVKVTDHAVLRYFERMEGYNIDEVYELIGKGVKRSDGMSKQVNADMTVVVEGDTVVTLYRNEYKSGNGIKGFENIKGLKQ